VAYNEREMGKALYRKYRSKSLSEIVGQEHITNALSNALATNRVSHAYLFTGPRGIGKTSIARILAHEVNQLPYDESATHLDIIEIDAASNRRIDEVRDLREKVHIAPTSAKYKVYIIDEVHMLTREAFNALLKTLEEPPAHVIFILATTEAHKLPETIISRTQHFAFKPIETAKVVEHLSEIAKKEKITIDKKALELIAEHGEGSFRDSISLLDQIRHSADKVTVEDVRMVLGITSQEIITDILAYLDTNNAKQLIITLKSLREQGIEPSMLAKQLAAAIRESLLQQTITQPLPMLQLLEKLIEVPASADPYAALEVFLLQAVFGGNQPTKISEAQSYTTVTTANPKKGGQAAEYPSKNYEPPAKQQESSPKPETPKKTSKTKGQTPKEADAEKSAKKHNSRKITEEQWPEVINEIKHTYNTLYGILRMAQPSFSDTTVTLTLAFAFHQKRLNEPKNRQIIAEAIEKISGATPEILCIVGEKTTPSDTSDTGNGLPEVPHVSGSNSLGTISNIFGGGELLES